MPTIEPNLRDLVRDHYKECARKRVPEWVQTHVRTALYQEAANLRLDLVISDKMIAAWAETEEMPAAELFERLRLWLVLEDFTVHADIHGIQLSWREKQPPVNLFSF